MRRSPACALRRRASPPVIKHAPAFLFDVLAFVNHCKKNGKEAILRFSKWTLSEPMVGDVHAGSHSASPNTSKRASPERRT
jgi:hypothetical protein